MVLPLPAPPWLRAHISLLLVFAACIRWHLPLKVKGYFRRKVTISVAKIISLCIPRGPETENNFPFSLASADSGENEDIQPPGPAGLLKVTSAVSTHLQMLPAERRVC